MYKVCVFVPLENTEALKAAMFEAGGGKVGRYACCSWQIQGEGQFLPLEGSNPSIGQSGVITKVAEYKVEMVVEESRLDAVIAALKHTHPYETPAYEVYKMADI